MFDGVGYRDFSLVYPRAYAPGSTLIGQAYATPLRSAYSYARNHGRMVLDQHYALPFRSPKLVRTQSNLMATTYVSIAEGYRFLHAGTTHLVCEAQFACSTPPPGALVYHRLRVTDGTNSDTATSTVRTEPQVFHGPADVQVSRQSSSSGNFRTGFSTNVRVQITTPSDSFSPYSWEGRQTVRLEVKLSDVAPGAVRRVSLEAYARDAGDAANARAYMPLHVGVWTEIR